MTDNNNERDDIQPDDVDFEALLGQLLGQDDQGGAVAPAEKTRPESGIPELDEAIGRIPGYGLPSTKTQSALLDAALESDDVDYVKSVLLHTWLHYQALEFALASYDFNAKAFAEGVEEHGLGATLAEHPAEVMAQVTGTNIILAAYEAAHATSFVAQIEGTDQVGALRAIYQDLVFEELS